MMFAELLCKSNNSLEVVHTTTFVGNKTACAVGKLLAKHSRFER